MSDLYDVALGISANRAQAVALERECDDLTDAYMEHMLDMLMANKIEALWHALKGFQFVYGPGWSKHAEAAGIPKMSDLNRFLLGRCNDGEGRWRGPFPLARDDLRPARGTWVVYQLLDADGGLLYIGSTSQLYERLQAHKRDKDFSGWRAAKCDNETACRDLETVLIDRHRPPLNRMIPRPKVTA